MPLVTLTVVNFNGWALSEALEHIQRPARTTSAEGRRRGCLRTDEGTQNFSAVGSMDAQKVGGHA